MAKPIFIVRVPLKYWDEETKTSVITQMVEELDSDYHTLILHEDIKEITFEMFSDKNIDPIKLEGLIKLVKNNLK